MVNIYIYIVYHLHAVPPSEGNKKFNMLTDFIYNHMLSEGNYVFAVQQRGNHVIWPFTSSIKTKSL